MSKASNRSFIPLEFELLSTERQLSRAQEFELGMGTRRTVRQFSSRQVPRQLIESHRQEVVERNRRFRGMNVELYSGVVCSHFRL
jgi:hypothetical protein